MLRSTMMQNLQCWRLAKHRLNSVLPSEECVDIANMVNHRESNLVWPRLLIHSVHSQYVNVPETAGFQGFQIIWPCDLAPASNKTPARMRKNEAHQLACSGFFA